MIVCIAEKPSVARDIADVLGAKDRRDGYIRRQNLMSNEQIGYRPETNTFTLVSDLYIYAKAGNSSYERDLICITYAKSM